jgi:hypothetical protein
MAHASAPAQAPATSRRRRSHGQDNAYCSLQAAVGWAESCTLTRAFWDSKGDSCLFADVEHELKDRPPLARHLLDLRSALERGEEADRSRLFIRLNGELEAEASESDCVRGTDAPRDFSIAVRTSPHGVVGFSAADGRAFCRWRRPHGR